MQRLRGLLAVGAAVLALLPAPALAAVTPSPTPAPFASEAWWVPVGLRGTRVEGPLVADGATLEVTTTQGRLRSDDGGASWRPGDPPPAPGGCAVAGAWQLCGGRVLVNGRPDPGSPDLGAGAHLIAAPGSAPGVVVAVAADGTVWRRTQSGDWGRALLLLPDSLVDPHVPAIAGLTAFVEPVSDTVYLGVDGYSVLTTSNTDGVIGDDWIRAGPGLPAHVLGIAADAAARAVYAATDDGLWVHHLRALPRPPDYAASDLLSRQIGTALVTLAGWVAVVLGLRRVIGRPG